MTILALPPSRALQAWVETFEPLTEAPAEAQLAVAVATISAAIGWKAPFKWGTSSEPCTISVILEAGSALGRKTTTANGARALVHEATHDIPEEHRGLYAHLVGHTSDRGLLELVAFTEQKDADRYELLPPPGHIIMWDEIGSLLGDPGVNRKGGDWQGRIRTTLLLLANGRHGGIKTGGTKIPASRCAVAIIGTVTRVELEQRVDTGILRDGFLGRFMLIPHNGRARLLSRPPTWTASQVQSKGELVEWLRRLSERREPFGDAYDLLTAEAGEERDRWYEEMTLKLERAAELNPSDQARSVAEAFGRLQTTQMKLAVVAAVADMPTDRVDTDTPIVTLEHVQWSQQVVETSLTEISLLAEGGGSPDVDRYRAKAVSFLANRGTVSRRDFLHDCTYKQLDADRRWKVVKDLHEEGVVTIDREQTKGRPRHIVSLADDDLRPQSEGASKGLRPEASQTGRNNSEPDTTIAHGRKGSEAPPITAESFRENGSTMPSSTTYDHNDAYLYREREDQERDTQTPIVKSVKSPDEPFLPPDDDIPF